MTGAPVMRRARAARAIIASGAFVALLAGCAQDDGSTFDSIDAFTAAYADAGGSCTEFVEQYKEDPDDPTVATCGESTELTLATDAVQAQELAVGYLLRDTAVLTSGNWLIADPDIATLQNGLGGRVLALEASAGPANMADGLAVDADGVVARDAVQADGEPGPVDHDTQLLTVILDPLNTYSATFWATNAESVQQAVDAGDVTLDLHVVAISDSADNGYSSSLAVNALACVAEHNPDAVIDTLAALFSSQDTDGWTLDELGSIAGDAGADNAADCIVAGDYLYWTRQESQRALATPMADGEPLRGVPTVVLDSTLFNGDVSDAEVFEDFLAG